MAPPKTYAQANPATIPYFDKVSVNYTDANGKQATRTDFKPRPGTGISG